MWRTTLKEAGLGRLLDLVSPKFFQVVPAATLTREAKALWFRWRDEPGFADSCASRERSLRRWELPISLTPRTLGTSNDSGDAAAAREADPNALSGAERRARGRALLVLYFAQLLDEGPVLLDLRPARFRAQEGPVLWRPAPLWTFFPEDFRLPIVDLYAGFYEDDDARFRRGLGALGLDSMESLFREHFGGDDQRAVRFRISEFVDTFHGAFTRLEDEGKALHGSFVPFGIYLATLYEHLQRLGGEFDVRGAWAGARELTGTLREEQRQVAR